MDDDVQVCEMLRRQLGVLGFETETCGDGRDAVGAYASARAAGRAFDGVILDLQVDNGWGGAQTLGELLKLDPQVRALVCSGSAEGLEADLRRQGFRAVLPKPYSFADLCRRLKETFA